MTTDTESSTSSPSPNAGSDISLSILGILLILGVGIALGWYLTGPNAGNLRSLAPGEFGSLLGGIASSLALVLVAIGVLRQNAQIRQVKLQALNQTADASKHARRETLLGVIEIMRPELDDLTRAIAERGHLVGPKEREYKERYESGERDCYYALFTTEPQTLAKVAAIYRSPDYDYLKKQVDRFAQIFEHILRNCHEVDEGRLLETALTETGLGRVYRFVTQVPNCDAHGVSQPH